jgi:hypothetical protein
VILALNILLSQFGWFASVVGAANNLPWAGPAIVGLVVAWHLHVAHRPATELQLIIVCSALGAVFDSLLVMLGWLRYPSGMLAPWLAPYWIVAMWALFATTLNISFRSATWPAQSSAASGSSTRPRRRAHLPSVGP